MQLKSTNSIIEIPSKGNGLRNAIPYPPPIQMNNLNNITSYFSHSWMGPLESAGLEGGQKQTQTH